MALAGVENRQQLGKFRRYLAALARGRPRLLAPQR